MALLLFAVLINDSQGWPLPRSASWWQLLRYLCSWLLWGTHWALSLWHTTYLSLPLLGELSIAAGS